MIRVEVGVGLEDVGVVGDVDEGEVEAGEGGEVEAGGEGEAGVGLQVGVEVVLAEAGVQLQVVEGMMG